MSYVFAPLPSSGVPVRFGMRPETVSRFPPVSATVHLDRCAGASSMLSDAWLFIMLNYVLQYLS